ncbi:SGNH/GDSL hydrolase family protein [Paenibacillus sp. J5C_2022]|uniref:SGNH/GDSL hydrolase family protein n=1 Tax=Paenibacillus sp. J5C2022 TaxID=2977129 RepID=UPI0021D0100A|nr:SGNH/GDSL hydrolase family protein [Paenibacillus sp. J5C2022]MCU6709943.1 SGNH/GDSL hydrolase family protein [Paenibacillus sp. J5C2022]
MSNEKMVILFQGDSITDGNRGRDEDSSYILGQGYPFLISGKLGFELAEKQPIFINRGGSGNRASELYARWNEDALNLRPDLISILIGVNDVGWALNSITDRFERSYRHLLEETKSVLPDTGLVLCEPFLLNTGLDRWEERKRQIEHYQRTVRRLAEQFQAVFVPLQEAFNNACTRADAAYWIWDGVHPTAAGHDLIAREWLNAVQNSSLRIT